MNESSARLKTIKLDAPHPIGEMAAKGTAQAKEAFEKGTSISGIFSQALIVRRALRDIDPWKSISEVQSANRGIAQAEVERTVAKAVRAVRKDRRDK